MSAVILCPSQGLHAAAFQGTSRQIIESFYCKKNEKGEMKRGGGFGFQTVISRIRCGKYQVDYWRADWDKNPEKPDFWTAVSQATTFIMLSHMGQVDGPILNHVDTNNKNIAEVDRFWQPWPTACITTPVAPARSAFATYLSPEGRGFWQRVGGINKTKKLKIVLLGCDSNSIYGPMVSAESKCPVFGFHHSCQAANHNTQIPNLTVIEDKDEAPLGMSKVQK